LQQVVQAQPRPSAEEVHKFYAQHPELFAQRRLFTLEEIEVTREASLATALQERLARAASMDEIADWLRLREIQHAFTRGVRAAEQIPLDLLPRLQAMKEGEVQAIDPGGDALFVIRVVATRLAPLDETAAAPLIEQFLLKRRWSEAIGTEMQEQRRAGRVEYVEERK
jgi:EpsD family peptidyl-prolyl cis-trans isomerase